MKLFFWKKKEVTKVRTSPVYSVPDFKEFNEFSDIVHIFDYVLHPDFEIANQSGIAINRLFYFVDLFNSKQLYENCKYLIINKADIKKFHQFDSQIEVTLLCIATLNGNGYTREEALIRLDKLHVQRTIPFFIFRLADWVVPIRAKAEQAIRKFITSKNAIYFIRNHKQVSWLMQVRRNDLSGLYLEIIHSISQKRLDLDIVLSLNEGERFFYYHSKVKMDMIDKDLINEMLIDKYYLIRMLVIKHFDKVSDRKPVLTKLLTDKSQKVRQNAVNLIANNHPNSFETILGALIFDTSMYIRLEARRILNKMNHYDFVQIYRNNLFHQKNSIGSILGLSEVSDENEIPLIQKYLGSESAKVKTAALIGIYNLDSNIGTELAYKMLENENPISTKRAAEKLLTKQSVDYDRLRVLYDATDTDGKKIILRLFNCFSGWSFAGDFLKALTDEDKKIQTMANVFLTSWLQYTVNLGISQNEEDRTYVLTWYRQAKEMEVKVPENIPFIFGEK